MRWLEMRWLEMRWPGLAEEGQRRLLHLQQVMEKEALMGRAPPHPHQEI